MSNEVPDKAVAFGRRLKALRRDQRYTQKEIARAAGISRQYVAVLEMGKNVPTFSVAEKLAHALGVSPEYLLWGTRHQATASTEQGQTARTDATVNGPTSGSTDIPLTEGHSSLDDIYHRLRRIELRLGEHLPEIQVIGRVPADGVRWATIRDVYEVEVRRESVEGARAPFGLEVTGDCWYPMIYPGDIVICDPPEGREPRDRQIVVVRIDDGVTLKRWCVTDNGIELRDGTERVVHTLMPGDDVEVQALYLDFIPRAPR